MPGQKPFRREKLAKEIVRETSRILLHDLKDPRLGFVTVTKAKVSDDYRHAKVFVSVMGDEKNKKLTMQALRHANGFVQHELSSRIHMRVFPVVDFQLDDSVEKTFRMIETLGELERERRARGAEEQED